MFIKKRSESENIQDILTAVANVASERRGDLVSKDVAESLVGMESLDETTRSNLSVTFEHVNDALAQTGLLDMVKRHYHDPSNPEASQEVIDVAMEAAAVTLMAAGSPDNWHENFIHGKGPSASARVIDLDQSGAVMPSMESFTYDAFDKFIAHSVILNALSVGDNAFNEALFPTEVIEAGQSGAEVSISIPYVYNRTKRNVNGKPFEFVKTPLLNAIQDHTILEGDIIEVYPRGDAAANNDAYLVDAADVANKTIVVLGQDVVTRPLKFGVETDLLAVSNHPGLIGDNGQNETDVLDPNVSLGKVYVKVSVNDGAATNVGVFEVDTRGLPGALFTRPAEGSTSGLTMNFKGSIAINSAMTDISSTSAEALNVHSLLGSVVTDGWTMEVPVNITGSANSEYANIEVFVNSAKLGKAYVAQDEVAATSPEYTALEAGVTVELLGYMPKARRVNANLRQRGLLVDSGETNRFYFPVNLDSPIASVRPLKRNGGGADLEALIRTLNTRSSNKAVTTLMTVESQLKAAASEGTVNVMSTMLGSVFVTPTYLTRDIDAQNAVTINRSGEGYDDLRALVVDAVTTMADRLVLESGYLAALEHFTGADKDYELVIATDPRIKEYLMKSGDARTFGEGRKYRIVASHDNRMRDSLIMTFRRVGRRGVDPLSFGSHLFMPALVHEVPNSHQSGTTVNETQVQSRELHVACLPVMGRINVTNIDKFYENGKAA